MITIIKNSEGDKVFEDVNEALYLISEWSHRIIQWLKVLQEEYGAQLPLFAQKSLKSLVLDLAMVTKRFIAEQYYEIKRLNQEIIDLRTKNKELSEDSLCPRCGGPRNPPR